MRDIVILIGALLLSACTVTEHGAYWKIDGTTPGPVGGYYWEFDVPSNRDFHVRLEETVP